MGSISTVLAPPLAAYRAAIAPDVPPPATITSAISTASGSFADTFFPSLPTVLPSISHFPDTQLLSSLPTHRSANLPRTRQGLSFCLLRNSASNACLSASRFSAGVFVRSLTREASNSPQVPSLLSLVQARREILPSKSSSSCCHCTSSQETEIRPPFPARQTVRGAKSILSPRCPLISSTKYRP